jgi:hypothetical protein
LIPFEDSQQGGKPAKAKRGASRSGKPQRLSQDQQIADAWNSMYGGLNLAGMVARIVTDSGQDIVR